jgi:hypothetical protein
VVGLLVLQVLVRAWVHGEDDQKCVGDGLVRGGRRCRSLFVLLGTAVRGSFASNEEPTVGGPGERTRGPDVPAKRWAVGMGVTARLSAGMPVSVTAGRTATLARPVRGSKTANHVDRIDLPRRRTGRRHQGTDHSTLRDAASARTN